MRDLENFYKSYILEKKTKKIINKNRINNQYIWFKDGKLDIYYNIITRNISKGLKNKTNNFCFKIRSNKKVKLFRLGHCGEKI